RPRPHGQHLVRLHPAGTGGGGRLRAHPAGRPAPAHRLRRRHDVGQRRRPVGAVTGGQGRVALVTGANRGIGLAIARALAQCGHRVAGTYRTDPPADDAAPGVTWVRCDVTDTDSVEQAFAAVEEQLAPVEVLVSNAGATRDGLVLRMSDDDFTAVLDANLTGAFR